MSTQAKYKAGPYFRKIRKRESWTIKALAMELKLSASYISGAERGLRMLPPVMFDFAVDEMLDPIETDHLRDLIDSDLWNR